MEDKNTKQKTIAFPEEDFEAIKEYADEEGYLIYKMVKKALKKTYGIEFPSDKKIEA